MRLITVLLFGFLLTGCFGCEASDHPAQVEPGEISTGGLPEVDAAQCEADGGFVERRGMIGLPICVTPYEDGGKACTDSSECQGQCILKSWGAEEPGEGPIVGSCEPDDKTFGCFGIVTNGKVESAICVD